MTTIPPNVYPGADLPLTTPGQTDSLVGVDESIRQLRRFPVDQLPMPSTVQAQINIEAAAREAADSALGTRVDALESGQAAGQLVYQTWAELSVVTGSAGQGAQVIGDTGTHTDPVSSETVSNAGQYRWTGSAWEWLRGDVLASKANKSDVDERAGTFLPVRDSPINVDVDKNYNVARALMPDGTTRMLAAEVGALRLSANADGSAALDGKLTHHGSYTEYALDLDEQYPDAILIELDNHYRVYRIVYKDGTVSYPSGSPETGLTGYFIKDFQLGGVNARVTTSDGYGTGLPDTLLLLCHGNGGDYTYAPSAGFQAWARANKVSYACISQQELGNPAWGNDAARNRVVALYKHLMQHYTFDPSVVLVGQSMGGLLMGQLAYYKPFPIKFALGIGPVPSLSYIFAHGGSTRQVPIRAAYGMASDGSDDASLQTFIHGYDWFLMGNSADTSDSTMRKLGFPRMHIYAGRGGDTTYSVDFGGDTNYPIIRDSLQRAGGYCALTVIDGLTHADDALWEHVLSDGVIAKEITSL